jgi:acetyltransferase-like isoleucine patch superfamily enzyme
MVDGTPRLVAPALLAGAGSISFSAAVTLGWEQGPGFFSGYTYIEARNPSSVVAFGASTHLNNCVTIVSEGPGVKIGERCVVGPGVHIYDSDFHAIDASVRSVAAPAMAAVNIADDVFIGSNAIVLKGVTVGAGSVVGAGALVTADVPERSVVGGNPARVLI